ncbi:MAG TPA: hypothetical protein VLD18_02925, partial [Verrucomicrobiae bacterium]|nr:hypothetical protein [Verrucomicrobiae bacterium]
VAEERGFTTGADGKTELNFNLPAGVYRAMLETQDRFGRKVTAPLPVQVLQPGATRLDIRIPHLVAAPKWSVEPGEEWMALWGTGYDAGRAFVEIEHRGKFLQRFWTRPGQTQQPIRQAVEEAMRGGFTVHVTQVRENRAYTLARHVDVPWSNKELELKWEHFTSKLGPAQQETWTAVISGSKAEKVSAEMVAVLYDASLDQFQRHHWLTRFNFFRFDQTSAHYDFLNSVAVMRHLRGNWSQDYVAVDLRYRQFPPDLVANFHGYDFLQRGGRVRRMRGEQMSVQLGEAAGVVMEAAAPAAAPAEGRMDASALGDASAELAGGKLAGTAAKDGGAAKGPDLTQVSARRNLNETAFFLPHLLSDSNGVVRMQFTMP